MMMVVYNNSDQKNAVASLKVDTNCLRDTKLPSAFDIKNDTVTKNHTIENKHMLQIDNIDRMS